jgi:hypothetical protein
MLGRPFRCKNHIPLDRIIGYNGIGKCFYGKGWL